MDAARLNPSRVVMLGMPCAFTRQVVRAAVNGNRDDPVFDLAAVVLAGNEHGARTGWPDGVAVEAVADRATFRSDRFHDRLAALAPDLLAVACFPWRVPRSIREVPRLGALNVHPSLLPDLRGPEPVFWAFRRGRGRAGVTIHRLDGGFDTGPILARQAVPIAEDATLPSLEAELAGLGGRLLHTTIRDLAHGQAHERPQPAGSWPTAPFPADRDLIVTTAWSARHVARFIRAVAPVHGSIPLLIAATGQVLPGPLAADDVVAVDEAQVQDEAVRWDGDRVRVRCTPGVVTLRLRRQAAPLTLHGVNARRA